MKKILVLVILFSSASYALEIDEKLTLRIKGTSNSKKTILINRGIEDGLAVGDHAKFFVSSGVIGRGVIIKTSPTRSVWSMYRMVNKDFLREEQVLKLKITPAVKLTKDESKMLVTDDSREVKENDPRDIGIPLAQGADDLDDSSLSMENRKVSVRLNEETINLLGRNREIYGMGSYSGFTQETKSSVNNESYSNDITNLYLKIGGEYYFKHEDKWYSRFSFLTHFALDRRTIMDYKGTTLKEQGSEFGFGVSIHPTKFPSMIHRLIPYLNYTLTLGSNNSSYTRGAIPDAGYSEDAPDASTFAHNVGGGFKYYTSQGIGMRLELSYVLRADNFAEDSNNFSWVRTSSGPRTVFGLSYRF